MNSDHQRAWQNDALAEIFRGIAQSETLCARLIFKGGRILHQRLGGDARQSYDLDAALTQAFVDMFPARDAQQHAIHDELMIAMLRPLRPLPPTAPALQLGSRGHRPDADSRSLTL